MKTTILRFMIAFLILLPSAFATTLETLFEDTFYTLHVPNRCGQNIMRFLELAAKENIDLSGAEIINVNSGWVEPVFFRNAGYAPKVPGPEGLTHAPAPRYFEFHVFLLHNNRVYDFDYGNTPKVHTLKTYLNRMWFTGRERDKYLGLQIYSAHDYLRRVRMPNVPTIPLLKFASERINRR